MIVVVVVVELVGFDDDDEFDGSDDYSEDTRSGLASLHHIAAAAAVAHSHGICLQGSAAGTPDAGNTG